MRADWVKGRALVVFGSQLTIITRKCARGRKRLGTTDRQLAQGTRLLQHTARAARAAIRLHMSQRRCLEVHACSHKFRCTVQQQHVLPARNPSQPSITAGSITKTGTALAQAVRILGRVWPPRTADRFYPTRSLASQKKDAHRACRKQEPTPLLGGGQCVIRRLVAPTNNPNQCAIANEMEENIALVMILRGP